jgi:hypothetical protein
MASTPSAAVVAAITVCQRMQDQSQGAVNGLRAPARSVRVVRRALVAPGRGLPALKLAQRQVTPLADEECVVLLGRPARGPAADLAAAAAAALGAVEHPLARRLLGRQGDI